MTTVALGEVVDLLSGFAFKSKQFGEQGDLPVVRIRDVTRGFSESYVLSSRSSNEPKRTSSTPTSKTTSAPDMKSCCQEPRDRSNPGVRPVPQESRVLPETAPHKASRRQGPQRQPLTGNDLTDLQGILLAAGIGSDETFAIASEQAGSFGLFIRSLVGLDRAAAKESFADFLDDSKYSKNQIEFINLIINYLTDHGIVEPGRVYDSPFTAVAPEGPESLFGTDDVTPYLRSHRRPDEDGGLMDILGEEATAIPAVLLLLFSVPGPK